MSKPKTKAEHEACYDMLKVKPPISLYDWLSPDYMTDLIRAIHVEVLEQLVIERRVGILKAREHADDYQVTHIEIQCIAQMGAAQARMASGEEEPQPWHLLNELRGIPTDLLKQLVAERVASETGVLYDAHVTKTKEVNDVSKKPEAQRRDAVRNAKQDKAHWEGQKAKANSPTSKETFQRAIDRNQAIIDKNS